MLRTLRTGWLPICLAAFLPAQPALATVAIPAVIVDTGAGNDQGGGWSLYDDRPTSNLPGFQSLAAKFTLLAETTIGSVEGWMNWGYGGRATFSVLADFNGLPGGFRHGTTVYLPATPLNGADWRGASGLAWTLTAGDYWLVFADKARDAGSGAMPPGAPAPLLAYASTPGLANQWMSANTLDLGVRIMGPGPGLPMVPEPASAALMLAGAGMLAFVLRRRQASAAAAS